MARLTPAQKGQQAVTDAVAFVAAATRGCYICRPDDPSADEEACAECDREFWANPMFMVLDEEDF